MAIARMTKISIALHSSHKEDILKTLQDESALHITKIEEQEEATENGAIDTERIRHLEATLNQIDDSIKFVQGFVKKGGFLAGLVPQKVTVSEEKYSGTIRDFDCEMITNKIKTINHSISKLRSERDHLHSKIEILEPWLNLKTPVELIKPTETTCILAGTVNKRLFKEETQRKAIEAGLETEKIDESKNDTYLLFLFHKSDEEKARDFLDDVNFAIEDFRGFKGTPIEIFENLQKKLNEIEDEIEKLQEQGKNFLDYYENLLITYDHTLDEITRLNAVQEALTTKTTYIIQGWVETNRKENLLKLIDSYEAAVMQEIEPLKDEKPPVKLVNKAIFRPFEIVTNLYGTPSYNELDPSPLLALFFAVFFGLCITDAGYGVILALLALFLMKKIPTGKKFLWLIFIGAIFTIIEGALLGGWFGDLFKNTYIELYTRQIMIFDPMKSYFVFYRLALAFGAIQIYWGLILKVYEEIRNKNLADAFFEGVIWLLLISSLLVLLFASNFCVQLNLSASNLFPGSLVKPFGILALLCSVIVIIFGARKEKSILFRIFLGGLRLTILGGIFSYLGDFLSYIRLMALGLVTAGIANAINDIGRMTLGIPVAGVVIFVIILIGGHFFNLGINTLGGFVHTLRLQYVEFFQKFFTGGGRSFTPLQKNEKYVVLKQT